MHLGSKTYACKRWTMNVALCRMKYEIWYKYKEAVTQYLLLFPFISDWQPQFGPCCMRSSVFFPFCFFFSFLFWLLLQHNGTKCHQHSGCTTCCPGCYTLRRDKVTKNWHQISTSSFVLFLEDYARTHRSWVTSGICSLCLKRQMKQQKTS